MNFPSYTSTETPDANPAPSSLNVSNLQTTVARLRRLLLCHLHVLMAI